MDFLLTIGLLLLVAYSSGWILSKLGLPKIIGYIATGIAFSPNSVEFIHKDFTEATQPMMDICLAFIAFEVGGALKWETIKKHEKEIINITIFASIIPYLLIATGIFAFSLFFPNLLNFDFPTMLSLALLLGALASPTAPAATIAVMHEYKAKGKVSDTIMGVAALDDVLGILLFSLTLGAISIINHSATSPIDGIVHSFLEIAKSIGIGIALAIIIIWFSRVLKIVTEGQWIVVISSLLILCLGISRYFHADEILACMTMGILVVNRCKKQKIIFKILERYTEDLIFLIFFLLSGMHLDITSIPNATYLILLFVVFRTIGKFIGAYTGAKISKADKNIQKYTAGGLLPQAGIVIGLVLSIQSKEEFRNISEILVTTIMGATVIHELIGPLAAKYSLIKAGEIKINK